MTTSAPQVTARPRVDRRRARLRELLPVPRRRAAVARRPAARRRRRCVLAAPAGATSRLGRLIWMDGQWFRLIATRLVRPAVHRRALERVPVLPAVPGARRRRSMKLGAPPTLALAGHLVAGRARRDGRRPPARRPAPAGDARRRGRRGSSPSRPAPSRWSSGYSDSLYLAGAGLGARARRGPPLVGGRAARRRRHGQPAERVDRRRRRRRHGRSSPAPAGGRSSPWPRRRWRSSSAGAGTCGRPPAIRSCSGRPRTAWVEMSLGDVRSPTRSRPRTGRPVPPRVRCSRCVVPVRSCGSGGSRRRGRSSSCSACCRRCARRRGLARYAVLAFPMPFAAADVLAGRRALAGRRRASSLSAAAMVVARRRWSSRGRGCRDAASA